MDFDEYRTQKNPLSPWEYLFKKVPFTQLESFGFWGTPRSYYSQESLLSSLDSFHFAKRLKRVDVSITSKFSEGIHRKHNDVSDIKWEEFPTLETLCLNGHVYLKEKGWSALGKVKFPRLKTLILKGCNVTDKVLEALSKNKSLKELETLNLMNAYGSNFSLPPASLEGLKSLLENSCLKKLKTILIDKSYKGQFLIEDLYSHDQGKIKFLKLG
jgi:hypothetical protein